MKSFATLAGTDTPAPLHQPVFDRLFAMALARGFTPPDALLPIRPDQLPIEKWSLELRGPSAGSAAFLLAVTAPRLPGLAPIPVRKTINGPLFAVVVMPTYFGVYGDRDFIEYSDVAAVADRFDTFLDSIP